MKEKSIAIVHEWLVNYAGSEKCVESFTNIWKNADVYSLVDFLDDDLRNIILKGKHAHASFIKHLPYAKTQHRKYLPLFPMAIESFNLKNYDLIFSSSHAVAKGARTRKDQLHICYCHSPMRYAWDEADYYLKEANLTSGLRGFISKAVLKYLRKWDLKSANNVNYFIANSNHIAKKIKRIYNRDSTVIYPPVDVAKFDMSEKKDDYYLIASRFVPYKKVDLVVEAFNQMPDKKLIVIGSGPEKEKIKNIAGSNIEFLSHQPSAQLNEFLKKAKAFVFAAEEDFGIIVVEAMACGTPVIALNKGGTAESVIYGKTGILFNEQNPDSIKNAVKEFEKGIDNFDVQTIRKHSEKFSRPIFEKNISEFVMDKLSNFNN